MQRAHLRNVIRPGLRVMFTRYGSSLKMTGKERLRALDSALYPLPHHPGRKTNPPAAHPPCPPRGGPGCWQWQQGKGLGVPQVLGPHRRASPARAPGQPRWRGRGRFTQHGSLCKALLPGTFRSTNCVRTLPDSPCRRTARRILSLSPDTFTYTQTF